MTELAVPAARGPAAAPAIDVGRLLDTGRWSAYQKWVVTLAALAIIFDGADIQILGVAIPSLMREWGVARDAMVPIVAVGLLGMMVGAVLIGLAGDRWGRRRALITCVVTFGVFTAATSQADSLLVLGALRFLAGVGLGGAVPNATALVSEYTPHRQRPFAVTLTIVCVPLGGTLVGVMGAEIIPVLGWRALFIAGGAIPLLVAILLAFALPESPRYLARRSHRWQQLSRILGRMGHTLDDSVSFADPGEAAVKRVSVGALLIPEFRHDTLLLWAAFFFGLLTVYTSFSWMPAMLTGAGLDVATASRGLAAFNLGGVAGAIGAALLIVRIGSRPAMLGLAAIAIAGALALAIMPINASASTSAIILMIAITGGAINAVQTTMYALAAHVYPTDVRVTGVGTASAVGRIGGLLSSFAGAWVIGHGGSVSFFVLTAAAMTATLLALALLRRHFAAREP